jgi:serine/threonine-protein kinase ULK/ATG1
MVRELVILETLDSPNVIKVHEFIKTTNNFYMVQEYANGGSLQRLLDSRGRFTEAISKKILKQIIKGMTALYDIKVAHRDLKLDNILVSFPNQGETITDEQLKRIDLENEEFVVKIADLGYSRAIDDDERAKTGCGTPL